MSIATYAYESDGSKCLKNGAYKVYIKNGKLILYDGTTEHIIDGGGSGDNHIACLFSGILNGTT